MNHLGSFSSDNVLGTEDILNQSLTTLLGEENTLIGIDAKNGAYVESINREAESLFLVPSTTADNSLNVEAEDTNSSDRSLNLEVFSPLPQPKNLDALTGAEVVTKSHGQFDNQAILESALALSESKIATFLERDDYQENLNLAFGNNWNQTNALALIKDLIAEKAIPEIQILPASTLKGKGAFDGQKIYLSQELIDSQDTREISIVFLEEFGHYLDSRINTTDSEGDEGEIFSRLVQNLPLDLETLKLEDDLKIINLDGQKVAIESADLPGIFTVDNSGKISVDWMADAGSYKGELAVFSLNGMENLAPGSTEYIQEAARRALSNTTEGYVILSDTAAGAKLNGELGERNFNRGDYAGISEFNFSPGTKVALFLVPVGTVKQVFDNPTGEDELRPLFSVATANPEGKTHLGQLTEGTFGWEDIRFDNDTDADYNDIIVQVQGLSGFVTPIEQLISPQRDWLNSETAQEIISLVQGESIDSEGTVNPVVTVHLANDSGSNNKDLITNDPKIVAEIDNRDSLTKLEIQLNDRSWQDITDTVTDEGLVTVSQAQLRELNNGELGDGDYQFAIRATDTEQGVSTPITLDFTLDTTAPDSPAQFKLANDEDLISSNNQPVITGAAPTAATVKLYSGDSLIGEADLVDGTWQISTNKIFADGKQPLNAVAIDAAGNLSTTSSLELLIDTIAPQLTIASPQYESQIASGSRLQGTVNGTGSEIVQLSYQFNDLPSVPITFNGEGKFDVELNLDKLQPGQQTLTVTTTDAANTSITTNLNLTLVLDQTAPEIEASLLDNTVGDGEIGNRRVRQNITDGAYKPSNSFEGQPLDNPTIIGKVSDKNSGVTFFARVDDRQELVDVSAYLKADGSFIFDRQQLDEINGGALREGEHTFTFIARDLFGNESEPLNLSFILEEGSPKGLASASRQEEVDNSLSEITDNQQRERSVVITPLASTITTSNLSNAAIKAEGSISISGNSDFDGEPLNLNDDAFIYAGKGFSINGKTVLPVKRNAAGDPLTDSSGKPILVDQAVTVANGYLYSNVSASNRYSGLVPPQIVDKQTIDVPVYTTELNGELNRRIPAGTPTVTFNIAQNPLNNASDWAKKFPASGTTTAPKVVKVTGGGLNIPSNVSLNNYVITVESGDLNFNGSGHNLNNSVLVTKAGNINFANAQTKDVKAFASGSINMNGGASFAGDSLLANNSSSGNINFSGATSTIKGSDELKVFSAGSITYNGASQTRGNFVSAGNFTFNGNSTLYGAIAAKGNIAFNGNATVVVVNSNSAPSDLSLNPTASPENVASNSAIGTFTTTDTNSNDTHTLSLVAGTGDTNNNAFTIVGNELRIKETPDFESLSSQSIRVRTTDNAGASFEKVFTVNITDVNEAPTEIGLNNLRINENVTNDSVVGIFNITDPDLNATHDLSLVAGEGDRDNAAFTIVGNQLRINNSPDFESKASYNLRVKATDVGGLSKEKTLTISVNDLNEVPTDLSLSSINFDENLPAESEIATLHTVDADAVDSHSLSLIAGEGDSDNNAFTIDGERLYFKDAADFETKANYNLRVRTTDAAGNSLEKILYLNVNNVNEAPTDIILSAASVAENSPIETVVATLGSSDPDAGDTHTYSLVAGSGDTDNNSFNLVGQELRLNNSADFESQSNYSIRIRSTDAGGLFKDEMVTISVQDSEDAEIALNLNLAQDTGADNTDNITSDPTIRGTVENSEGDLTLSASLNGAEAVELSDLIQPDGSFTLGNEQLKLIHNGDLVDGSYTLQLIAKDSGSGKTTESELAFTLDTSAPTLNLITPLADGDHSSKARLTGTVTEDNLADVTYSLDGESIGAVTVDAKGHFNSEINPSGLEIGTHTVKAIATDMAGNKTTRSVSFQVGDNFLTPEGTKGWGVKNDSSLILGEQDSYVVETSMTVELGLATNEEGEQAGTRTISFDLDAVWDEQDAKAIEDQLLVYLVDPANPSQTLLNNGQQGTAVFSLAGEQADFTPGLVTFDGKRVTIDASSLKDVNEGLLVFQLLNQDDDTGSSVTVNNLTSTTDLEGFANPVFPEDRNPVSVGAALNFNNLTQANEVETIISNVRFDAATGEYRAAVRIKNNGATAIARNSVVVFNHLPDGVELASPSGTDNQGNPYVNLRGAIASGGLEQGKVSESVEVVLTNPNLIRFGLDTSVFVGRPNTAPVLAPIDNLTVIPGAKLELPLAATDRDGDLITYRLQSDDSWPTGTLEGDGILKFNPKPDQIGSYEFTLIATDGVEEVSQTVTLDVVADPVTTTRISGVIQNVEQQPLAGVVIELGELETVTAADGSFTIETDQPLTADTLKVRGEGIEGNKVYPFIAEKLPLLLGQEVYAGFNNVIDRPIYLPTLDIASGKVIDPNKDITVTSENIPEASVFVEAGSLTTPDGADFKGTLSITEVPTELTPAALPENLSPDLVVTIQPGEMVFNTPAPLSLPNLAGYEPGTAMDLWSINPETGDFDKVGTGRVSDDGSAVETVDGGIRNSSWHFFAPPPPPVRPPGKEPRNGDDKCSDCTASGSFNSEVEYHSGAVIETHDLTTYSSNGSERGITLTYDSLRADPRPIVHFGYDNITQLNAQQKLIADLTIEGNGFEYQVPGFAGGKYGLDGGEHVWSIPNNQSGDLSVGLQADLRELPSGLYDYTVNSGLYRFGNNLFTGSSTDSTGDFLQVNTIDSDFGSGWSIAGWQEIVENSDRSVLLIDGDGSELLFEAAPGGAAGYVSPPGDFSTLEKLADGTFKRTTTDQMVYEFNSANDLAAVTDRNGNQTSYEYNSQGQLTKIVDPVGLATVLSYNEAGLVSKITDPGVRVTELEYDPAGNLTRITDPDGATRTWSYDANRLMISEIDPRGNQERATYDQFGRAESAQLKDGTTVQVDPLQTQGLYSPEATINPLSAPNALIETKTPTAAYVDELGNVTVTEVDRAGQAISAVDGAGQLPTTERNQQNLITKSTDGRGNESKFTYDEQGNVLTIEDSLTLAQSAGGNALIVNGAAASSEPQLALSATSAVDSLLEDSGYETTISEGIPQDISEYEQIWDIRSDNSAALSNTQSKQYLDYLKTGGNLFLFGENSVFKTRNNSLLNLIDQAGGGKLDFVLPSTSQTVLAPFDSPNPITDQITFKAPGGVTSAGTGQFIATDEDNRGLGVAFERGSLSQAAAGELTAIFDLGWLADASSNENLQKLLNNLAQLKNQSALQSYSYDPLFNQVTSYTDELGRLTLNDLDPNNGNLLATTRVVGQVGGADDLTTSYSYTDAGLVDIMTDPLGRVTDYQYDLKGRLVKEIQAVGTAEVATVQYEYDAVGNQTAVIDENGNRSEFEYDQKNRVTKITEADPDGVGDLTSPVTSLTYDQSGNLVKTVDPLGNITQQAYDELNRLSLVTNSLGEKTSYEYDNAGNASAIIDGNGRIRENRYDSRDRLTETIDPLGNKTKYRYDLNDNLTAVTDALGNKTASFYDSRDRLFRTIDGEKNITSYEYDGADNLIATVDGNGHRREFEYDQLDRQVKRIDAKGGESTITYDQVGNVIATTDEEERTTELAYDNRDRLTETTNALDGVASFEYDDVGNLLATTDEENRTTNYSYDALNRQTSITDPLNNVTTSKYDANGNLISLTDANNHTTNFEYDVLNRTEVVTNAAGDRVTTSYDAVGNVESVTDELGRTTTFEYDERNLQTSITDPLGNTSTNQYDAVGNLDSASDALGNTTSYEYDKLYRLINEIDAEGGKVSYQYDSVGNLLAVTDQLNRTTNFAYDELNRQVSITNSLDNTTTNQYDGVGNLTSVTDANNHTTTFAYDGLNRKTVTTNALGDTFSTEYDAVGNVTSATDELNRKTEFTYDERNLQTTVTDALGHITTNTYDPVGNLASITDARDNTTEFDYDELNRQTVVTNALGDRITTEYDAVDHVIAVTDELDRTTEFAYDERNLQTTVTDALGHTTTNTYDPVGNLLSVTDPLNLATSFSYDQLNRTLSVTNPNHETTSYQYDPVGNQLSITDPENNTTSYTYDDLNRTLTDTNQLGDTKSYQYDAVGNVVKTNDRNGRVINYAYDQLNRNTSEVWLDANNNPVHTFDFEYDAASQLTNAQDSDSAYGYEYDEDGRVTSVDNVGTPSVPNVVLDYTYDPVDNLTTVKDSINGVESGVETFGYDQLDRVTKITQRGEDVTEKRVDMTYDKADQMTGMTRYSNLAGTEEIAESNYTFDNAGRLTDIVHEQNAATLAEFNLEYDQGDRITQFTTPDGVSNFTYDDTDQLVDAEHSYQDQENFTYDDNGNRTNTGYVTGENNQLLSDGTYNYQYDQEGNRTKQTEIATGEVTEYEWDHRNRLVGVETKDSNGDVIANSEYTYDVNNNRIAKSVDSDGDGAAPATQEHFVYDGDHIALTFDGEGNQTERFLHGTQVDQVLAQENADGEVLWALTDNQGSVRMLLDNNGNVVNEITYDAFGNITLETHPDVNFRFSYTGREFDSETGLYNYRARYYDPGVGRFISEDPIGFEAGDSNIYRYVGNNPLFYVDPSGFCGVAASGEPEFFGPAFGPDSSPGGSDIGSGLDFFGLGGFSGFAPGGFGGFGVAPFPGDGTVKVAGSLTSDSLLDDDSDDSLGPDPYQLPDPYYGLGSGAGDLGPWVGIGVGLGLGSHFSQTDDGYKFTIDVKNIGNGFQDWWNRLTKGDDSNEFDPTIIDVFDGDLGISTNVEKFPRPDDFLKGDTFTFPGSGNVKVKDYIETFPKGIDDWLESPFFESSNNDNLDDFLHPDPGSLISSERELAQKYGVSTRDVKDAIHASKRSPEVRANTKNKNPDIGVDETGEIYIKLGKEKFSGDSIGNIQDYLP